MNKTRTSPCQLLMIFIYLFVNDFFLFKYVPNLGNKIIAILLYDTIVVCLLYWLNGERLKRSLSNPSWIFLALPLILVIYTKVSPLSVTPDRWSALYYWSDNLMHGIYPYAARTHRGGYGSPFPIWQILHLPFYFLGDEIFAHIIMLIGLFLFLRNNRAIIVSSIFSLLLLLSPAYWWEVVVRSDLMNNMLLAMMSVIVLATHKDIIIRRPFFIAFILGLASCTRLFLFIPFLIYLLPSLRKMVWRKRMLLFAGWLSGFILPILPILIWNANMLLYFEYSPIVLQIRQGSLLTFIIGLTVLTMVAFIWKDLYQYCIVTSCFLLVFILMMFVRRCYYEGFSESVFRDSFDLSYFSICLPFVLVALSLDKKYITIYDRNFYGENKN